MDGIVTVELKLLKHNLKQDMKNILDALMFPVPDRRGRLSRVRSSLNSRLS